MNNTLQTAKAEAIPMVSHETNNNMVDESCRRCEGLMVTDRCLDLLSDSREIGIVVRRCIQCGEIIDPTIIHNRHSSPSPVAGVARKKHWTRSKSFGLPLTMSPDTSLTTTIKEATT